MDNDLPTWKLKSSVVATNNLVGGTLAGKWLATQLKAGDTLGVLEGVPGVPGARRPRQRDAAGLGATKAKIKIVSKLETDCDQTKGAAAAQTMLTANPNLTAIYSACGPPALGAIQSIKNAGSSRAGSSSSASTACRTRSRRSRRAPRTPPSPSIPTKIGSLGIATLYAAVQRQEGAEERRHRDVADHAGRSRAARASRRSPPRRGPPPLRR